MISAARDHQAEIEWLQKTARWGSRTIITVAILALVFTMVNVQVFAATGHTADSFEWWIAWLLDPMASITMGAAIIAESILADYGRTQNWLIATKWYAGGATWGMNIWHSVVNVIPSGIFLHSVAPGLILLLAEAAPRCRRKFAAIIAELTQEPVTVTQPAQVVPDREIYPDRPDYPVVSSDPDRSGQRPGSGPDRFDPGRLTGPDWLTDLADRLTGPSCDDPTVRPFPSLSVVRGPDRDDPVHPPSPAPDQNSEPAEPVRDDPVSVQRSGSDRTGSGPEADRDDATDRPDRSSQKATTDDPDRTATTDEQLVAHIRSHTTRTGKPPSAYQLKTTFNIGSSRAARVLTNFRVSGSRRSA
jgi:hypothetical protein